MLPTIIVLKGALCHVGFVFADEASNVAGSSQAVHIRRTLQSVTAFFFFSIRNEKYSISYILQITSGNVKH